MKAFEVPKVEVVRFGKMSVFTTSCVPCPGCPPGSYGCPCVDPFSSDYSSPEAPEAAAVPNMSMN